MIRRLLLALALSGGLTACGGGMVPTATPGANIAATQTRAAQVVLVATTLAPTATRSASSTPVPPTATVAPTNTPLPPTSTAAPPTPTAVSPTALPPTPVPPTATRVPPTAVPTVAQATAGRDEAIAADISTYLRENFGMPPFVTDWYPFMSGLAVHDNTVTVSTSVLPNTAGKQTAIGLCAGVSGYAFARDHASLGLTRVIITDRDQRVIIDRHGVGGKCV